MQPHLTNKVRLVPFLKVFEGSRMAGPCVTSWSVCSTKSRVMNILFTILSLMEKREDCLVSCGSALYSTTKQSLQRICGTFVGFPLPKTKFALYRIEPISRSAACGTPSSLTLSLMTSAKSSGSPTLLTANEKNVSSLSSLLIVSWNARVKTTNNSSFSID